MPPRGGKVGRTSEPRDIGVAGGVHGDTLGIVAPSAAEVGGIAQHRINDERLRPIIGHHSKADLMGLFAHIATGYLLPDSAHLLIDEWFVQSDLLACDVEDEVALRLHFECVGADEGQQDGCGVSPGGHDEVVFQLPLVTIVD